MKITKKHTIIEKTCSCGCGIKFRQANYLKGFVKGHSRRVIQQREKSPSWKGGILNKRGYIFIYSPDHPHNDGNYVKRSRLEMEKKLGRYLETREHVHHINGIKNDDRIENLVLLSISDHRSHHNKIPEGKWAWKYERCSSCLTNIVPHYAKGMCHRCYMRNWK